MSTTLEQYIGNPMSKAALLSASAREAMRNEYVKKYNEVLLREHGKIDYHLYKNEKKNIYYAHFKIPSEKINKFYYDVVLEFSTDEDVKEAGQNLFKYNCRFYSNDPAFVYTYAYAFINSGLFIDELKSKMSRKAIRNAAKDKNPYNQIGYVKTIYFAYLTMVRKSLNQVRLFESNAGRINSVSAISSNITNADTKISDREDAGRKAAKEKKKEDNTQNTSPEVKKTVNSTKINKVSSVKSVGSIKSISGKKKTR